MLNTFATGNFGWAKTKMRPAGQCGGACQKTCRDDAGTVLQAEMTGQPLIKDAWTLADRRPVSNYQGMCQASFNSDYGVMLS